MIYTKMRTFYLLLLSLFLLPTSFAQNNAKGRHKMLEEVHQHLDNVIESPDGKIIVSFQLENETPCYSVTVDGQEFIRKSRLGLEMEGSPRFKDAFKEFYTEKKYKKPYVWEQPWGENKVIHDHHNEMTVVLSRTPKHLRNDLYITFRIFNDGIGIRYALGENGCLTMNNIDSLIITDELTEFNFATEATTWSIPADYNSYEYLYAKAPLSSLTHVNTPMTFCTAPGLYGSIHEAALADFPEMTLKRVDSLCLRSELASWPNGIKAYCTREQFVYDASGNHFSAADSTKDHYFCTPWRTIQIGRKAVDLINSNLILNLNEPCRLQGDLSWIRPMKYIGIWWGMHLGIQSWTMDERHGATTANAIRYIDFAADNNIDAVLFEGWNEGWETWGGRQNFDFTKPYADFDMDSIVRYAKSKGVAIISHHETGGNIYNYERQLEHTYLWLENQGIHCVKTGYAGGLPDGHSHHGQFNVRHYNHVVEVAAAHQVMLDVHEPIKPTGERRTYPNMMTREGVRGMEWNAWSDGNPPSHHEILPFTRMLAGPLDYTPGTFDILFEKTKDLPTHQKWNDNDKGNSRVHTTIGKQLANWVILYSPLQMASDMIEHYENHPCFQFFRDFNPDCDWSRALFGEIGEYVGILRQAKNDFFIGVSTNEESRVVDIPLKFLPKGKKYVATIYADAPSTHWETNPTTYVITKRVVTNKDVLEDVWLAPGGGCAISLIYDY